MKFHEAGAPGSEPLYDGVLLLPGLPVGVRPYEVALRHVLHGLPGAVPSFRQGLVQHGWEDVGGVPGLAGEAKAGAYGVRTEVGSVGQHPVHDELDGVLIDVGGVCLHLVNQDARCHALCLRHGFSGVAPEEPLINEAVS